MPSPFQPGRTAAAVAILASVLLAAWVLWPRTHGPEAGVAARLAARSAPPAGPRPDPRPASLEVPESYEEPQEPELVRIEADEAQRLRTLERLRSERPFGQDTPWAVLDGCPRPPSIPAALCAAAGGPGSTAGSRLYLVSGQRLERYDVEAERWADEPFPLREPVGEGVNLLALDADTLVLASGGERRGLWTIATADGALRPLPDAPEPLKKGAALENVDGALYLCPGGRQDALFVLEPGAEAWERRGRIGGESPMTTTLGRSSGFLARLGPGLYAWPDHHIHRMEIPEQHWKPGNWLAMNFLPALDGGGVAPDEAAGMIYVDCGMYSRSLATIVPAVPPERASYCFFLKPRLPYPMIGGGDRLAVADKGGVPQLFAYAVEPDNKLLRLPTAQLQPIHRFDQVADVDSPWHRIPINGGGAGVRRWDTTFFQGIPLPNNDVPRIAGTLAVVGPLGGDELFLLRRAFLRRTVVETGAASFYPGINIGKPLALGGAACFDGLRSVYIAPGRSTYFVRWERPDRPPISPFQGELPPIDTTEMEILPELPADTGRGGALAWREDGIYALRGGARRDFWRYLVGERRWEVLAPLPDEAQPVGESRGAGLVANALGVFAVDADRVWRYDVEGARWEAFATLPFALEWDGGMAATDDERHLYLLRGGVSYRLGRLDYATRRYEDLQPVPPDVVSSEGNRLAIQTTDGERRLYVHRGHNSNEFLWVALEDLHPVEPAAASRH